MIQLDNYIKAMKEAVKDIADATYEGDRPMSVANKTDSFIVVDIPGYIINKEIDQKGTFNDYTTTVVFYVFVRDKITSERVGIWNRRKLSEMTQKVLDKFPIVNEELEVRIGNPRVIFSAADGHDFHYSTIQANLTTYF